MLVVAVVSVVLCNASLFIAWGCFAAHSCHVLVRLKLVCVTMAACGCSAQMLASKAELKISDRRLLFA